MKTYTHTDGTYSIPVWKWARAFSLAGTISLYIYNCSHYVLATRQSFDNKSHTKMLPIPSILCEDSHWVFL